MKSILDNLEKVKNSHFDQFSESDSIIYFSPGTGNAPIDQTVISAEFPQIKVFRDGEEDKFTQQIQSAKLVYIHGVRMVFLRWGI